MTSNNITDDKCQQNVEAASEISNPVDIEKPILSPFDPSLLRLSQNFVGATGVKKLVTTIPVRKPNKQDFVRVHPDPNYRLETMILELKEEGESYLVASHLWPELIAELIPLALLTAINRQQVLFIWPVRLPCEDGKPNSWHTSALDAARRAENRWIRVGSNMNLGAYEVFLASGDLPDPEWPAINFTTILKTAFKGKEIEDLDHPVLRRLRGEV